MLYRASAPGSLMLLGEYAVLHGKPALVCAIDKRMTVSLTPREDNQIMLSSSLGRHKTTLPQLNPVKPFQFVLAALAEVKEHLMTGCDIVIESEFSATVGFASSAAVTVAMLSALSEWLELDYTPVELITIARKAVRKVQGLGSGADVAACVMGGLVHYQMSPLVAEKFVVAHPISVIYSGSKTSTVEAVKHVQAQFATCADEFTKICDEISECTFQGIAALQQSDWQGLGAIMNAQQEWMELLGVNTPIIAEIIKQSRLHKSVMGAKISGSGLGDCVVTLGEVPSSMNVEIIAAGVKQFATQITQQGVYCEKI